MDIVLQFYPNGEFSQGVDTSSSRPPKHVCKQTQTSLTNADITYADIQEAKRQSEEIPYSVYATKGYLFVTSEGAVLSLVSTGEKGTWLEWVRGSYGERNIHTPMGIGRLVHLGLLKPLVHHSVESCDSPATRKKLTSMSKSMSRNIRNGVFMLEQGKGGKDVLSFLTLTLPNLSTEGLSACCQNWDSMVKRFFDWLRIALKRKGIALEHVYCTEIQSKRLQNKGEYAPHLHIVFKGRLNRKSAWAITPTEARSAWERCIRAYTDEQFETKALENLQRIKYSAARYLSKYLSKGSNIIPQATDGNPITVLKTQWGGMARTVSKSIRQATQRFTGAGLGRRFASSFTNALEGLLEAGHLKYFKRGFIQLDTSSSTGVEYGLHVSCGCLSAPTYSGYLSVIMDYLMDDPLSVL